MEPVNPWYYLTMKQILFKAHNIRGEYRNCLVCENKFWAFRYRIKSGQGKYCSNKCANISIKGKHLSPETEFKKGHVPAKRSYPRGENHHMWKGDSVGYHALHNWVRRQMGSPYKCQRCGSAKNMEWANISGDYKRDVKDWAALCKSCHNKYDDVYKKIWISRRNKRKKYVGWPSAALGKLAGTWRDL